MVKHYVPEVHTITAEDDPNSTVDPYYNNYGHYDERTYPRIDDNE